MKIRTTIAVMAAKITGHVCKLMGRQGVTWAGKVAMKICPDILEELSSQVREKIFVVCGTNGKTTTNTGIVRIQFSAESCAQHKSCHNSVQHIGTGMITDNFFTFCLHNFVRQRL